MKPIKLLALICIMAVSCQSEETVVRSVPENNLVSNTTLTGKLMRVAQYPTAIDNVVDGSSCFSVNRPFTVTINSQNVTVDGTEDYQAIRNIIAEDNNGDDVVAIQFPVTVTYADYTQTVIASQAQFTQAVSNCLSSVELSCIDIIFPLTVNTYNSQNQLADSFGLATEQSLYNFLRNIGMYDAVSVAYPLNFSTPGGTVLALENNTSLEAAIDSYTDECLQALNPDPDPGPSLNDVITEGTWYVSYFFRDQDDTGDYAAYDFTFNANGTSTVTGGSGAITGTWAIVPDNSDLELDLTFSSSALNELEEDWTVTSYTPTLIKLRKVSGGGDDIRYLHFTKN